MPHITPERLKEIDRRPEEITNSEFEHCYECEPCTQSLKKTAATVVKAWISQLQENRDDTKRALTRVRDALSLPNNTRRNQVLSPYS